jgi:hypothetical protein
MKIKNDIENLKRVFNVLKKLELSSLTENSLFFPFEIKEKVEERETGIILTEIKSDGHKKFISSGFVIDPFSETPLIAYVSTEYSVEISLWDHINMFKDKVSKLSNEERELVSSIDCLIVKSSQILAKFKF